MLKDKYDALNNVIVNIHDYDEIQLSEFERQSMKKRVFENMNHQGKKKNKKRYIALVACLCLVFATAQTSFAKELADRIIKSISTGYNNFEQVEARQGPFEVPDELAGFMFDENGNEMNIFEKGQGIYDKNGTLIMDKEGYATKAYDAALDEFAKLHPERKISEDRKIDDLIVYDVDEIDDYADFQAKLPASLPEGYTFKQASFYKEEDGSVSGLYLSMEFVDGQGNNIYMDERLLNDDTAFCMATDGELKEVDINGNKAVVCNGRSIDFEMDGVSVGISGRGNLTEEQLIEMAKNVR